MLIYWTQKGKAEKTEKKETNQASKYSKYWQNTQSSNKNPKMKKPNIAKQKAKKKNRFANAMHSISNNQLTEVFPNRCTQRSNGHSFLSTTKSIVEGNLNMVNSCVLALSVVCIYFEALDPLLGELLFVCIFRGGC